jgi:hypothetical protein
VTKDLAHDFDVGPCIDLSARVTVSKRMSTDRFCFNTGQTSVVPDAVTNGPAGYWFVRHILSKEKVSY